MRPQHAIRCLIGSSGLAWALAQPAMAQVFDLSRPGVICDARTQVCYDAQGFSVPITRQTYGPAAANRVLVEFSGRKPQREYTLSGGEVCNLNRRVCWDDAWRRQVNPLLSRQLFGPWPTTGPAVGTVPPAQAAAAGERMCQLIQRGLSVFNGPCRLYRQNETVWQYYVVQMENGRLYRFQRRASQLVLNDATGSWPVLITDRGNAVQFRWANLLLDVSRPRQPRGGAPDGVVPPTPTPRSTGETSQDLLDNLFP